MRRALALGFLATAVSLPAHAGTVWVPLAIDEPVGAVRYRTEIEVANRGDAPAQIETLFVSEDEVSHPGVAMTVPARDRLLARIVPAGARGQMGVTVPAGAISVVARLVAYGPDGDRLASAKEPVLAEADLIPAGQPMRLQNLPDPAGAVVRLGVFLAGGRGSCSLAGHGDMASGTREIVSVSASGAAASRAFAERLQALSAGSLAGAWFVATCDAPAYPYAAVLALDGGRAAFVGPLRDEVIADPTLTLDKE